MEMSRITSKYQATVPADVRTALGVTAGDQILWKVENGIAHVRKVRKPIDQEWHAAISATLADEWLSDEDEEGYRDL
ncbi:MAG: transcriptional regulator, AbrB family [Sphingomonadales bacterium]|nr:transcriptional regulator, AbrB family [Sphingomonadales bacterium]